MDFLDTVTKEVTPGVGAGNGAYREVGGRKRSPGQARLRILELKRSLSSGLANDSSSVTTATYTNG